MISDKIAPFITLLDFDEIKLELPTEHTHNDVLTGIEKNCKSSYPHLDMTIDEDNENITITITTENINTFDDDINILFEGIM